MLLDKMLFHSMDFFGGGVIAYDVLYVFDKVLQKAGVLAPFKV